MTTNAVVAVVILSVVGAFTLLTVFGALLLLVVNSIREGSPDATALVVATLVVAVVVAAVILIARRLSIAAWGAMMKQTRFAQANGLLFSARDANPVYPGAIFQTGSERAARDHFRASSGRYLDFGNYRYTTGSGKNRSTHHWGFLALQLDRALPHLVLDSRANNGLFGGTNLPLSFHRDQTLSLEGDFDRHFTLYCPREYEADALYVLTPDMMALLIDDAATFDVEIIDSWMFVYSAAPFDMTDPSTIERLRRIVVTVGAKTVSRTERYADERVVEQAAAASAMRFSADRGPGANPRGDALTARMRANEVAPEGRRLRRRYPILGVVFVAAMVGVYLVTVFGGR
ncbi:MAG: hypothetical protein RI885_626 [Actinomycetota bacterium]|jgi:hypothetical protein